MSIDAIHAIVESGANVTLNIKADDLRSIVNEMIADERKRIEVAISQQNEQATISRRQTAQMLGVSVETLRRWEHDDYLTPVRIGRKVLYRRSDIEATLTKRTTH